MNIGKDDLVVYGKNGICLVEDIKDMQFGGDKGTYYVLRPKLSPSSTVYVPLSKPNLVSKMRSVMTVKELDGIIELAKNNQLEWIEDKAERQSKFNSIILNGNSAELLLLAQAIHIKKAEKEAQGRQLSSSDEGILKTALRLIEEEFSFSLKCGADEVREYIDKKFK